MTKTMQLVLAMAMVAAPVARAQQAEVQAAVPAVELQAAQTTGGNAADKDELFAGTEKFAKGAKESSELNLGPKTMGMVPSGKGGGELARKMKFMVIRNYVYEKVGMYSMDNVEVYRKKLNDWQLELLDSRAREGRLDRHLLARDARRRQRDGYHRRRTEGAELHPHQRKYVA